MKRRLAILTLIVFAVAGRASALEPNQTFETATVLAPGVLSVADELYVGFGSFPDTYLGAANQFGSIYLEDDDGSHLGNGVASALYGVPTNSGSIDFHVTGYPDTFFSGAHDESGQYELFVDAYDFFGDLADSFRDVFTLGPGEVHSYSLSDFNWIGGSYDVYIDNTVGPVLASDVDFYRFTGLTPGTQFTARTTDPAASGVDTYMGLFDDIGQLLEADDDDGGGLMALIAGTVPASGMLTFAVTGYQDLFFIGDHAEEGSYTLLLEIGGSAIPGDYNDDGFVDAADYTVWRNHLGEPTEAAINEAGNREGGVDLADYGWWKQRYGTGNPGGASLAGAVPEPGSWVLVIVGALGGVVRVDALSRKRWAA